MDNQRAKEIIKELQEHCEEHVVCVGCHFKGKSTCMVSFGNISPAEWIEEDFYELYKK